MSNFESARKHTPFISYRDYVECEIAARLGSVSTVLEKLGDYCRARGISELRWQQLQLATAEAINNAIEHGNQHREETSVKVQWSWNSEEIEIAVFDQSSYLPTLKEAKLPDDPLAEGGRGTFLIHSLTDRQEHRIVDGRHCLTLNKHLGQPRTLHEEISEIEQTMEGMAEDLSNAYENLSAMFHFGEDLATTPDLMRFVQKAIYRLLVLVGGRCAYIRSYTVGKDLEEDREPVLKMLYHSSSQLQTLVASIEKATAGIENTAFDTRQVQTVENCAELPESDPLRNAGKGACVLPICFQNDALGILVVFNHENKAFFSAGQCSLMQVVADFLGIAWTTSKLQVQREAQQRTLRELEIAKEIQSSLLPKAFPSGKTYRIYGTCLSAQEVGGDFFDVISLENPKGVLLVIADVMGKGVPAALLATIFRTMVHARRDLGATPEKLLEEINYQLTLDVGSLGLFITAQVIFLSVEDATLTFSNAGHCPWFRFSQDTQSATQIRAEGLPLGIFQDATYSSSIHSFNKGEKFVLITDGIYEVTNPTTGNMLGLDTVAAKMPLLWSHAAETFCANLFDYLDEYSQGAPASDDQTLLIIDFL